MGKIFVEIDSNNPRYVCTDCTKCNSTFGTSFCSVKDRGCCFYYPEFSLLDIQRMVKTLEGLIVLDTILAHPGTTVQPYSIQTKGVFDKELYDDYMKRGKLQEFKDIRDLTIFFKACPFVKSGQGCTMPPRYRNVICNTFICDELLSAADNKEAIKLYMEERSRYARWVNWENAALKHILSENNVNLVSYFNASIRILQEIPLNEYEFPELDPVITGYDNDWSKGA